MRNVFVDCGASDGGTVLQFLRRYPNGEQYEIHAFEPDERFQPFPNVGEPKVTFHREAVWVEDGHADFYIGGLESSSLIREKTTGGLDRDHPARVVTIDFSRWLSQFPPRSVVLKMDVEGAEYAVLGKMIDDGTIGTVREIHVDWHWKKIGLSRERHKLLIKRLSGIPLYDLSKSQPAFLENYP